MNADTWLRIATADLPEPVAERVARDTREHLEDAALGAGADVDPLLGAPEATAQELRKLYLTREEWEKSAASASVGSLWLSVLFSLTVCALVWQRLPPALAAVVLLYALGNVLSWRLHPLRRRGISWLLAAGVSGVYLALELPEMTGLPPVWVYMLLLALLLRRGNSAWQQDQRLRRTLRLMAPEEAYAR